MAVLAAAALTSCVSRADYDRIVEVRDNQARVISDLTDENRALKLQYDQALQDRPSLIKAREKLDVYRDANAKLEAELKKRFEVGPLPAGITRESWGLRVGAAVLFQSGQHKLTSGGQTALRSIASSLQGLKIRIEGHTDTDPVRATKARYPYGNLELSVKRGLEVANFLIKQCGLDPKNVSCAGMGEHFPVASNASQAGKAKNRRVDIRALEVAAESDTP